MSDEPIVEYLQSRTRVTPPLDLVAAIGDAIADAPQQRRSWFAPLIPAAAAGAAVGVVVVAAILVGGAPDAGPPPDGSPISTSTSPTSEPTPSRSPPLALRVDRLTNPGDRVTMDAVDADGRWGTITLIRGEDVGGYGDGSVPEDDFVVEMYVTYSAERTPDSLEFGAPDWSVDAASGERIPKNLDPSGRLEARRPTLGTYPGTVDIFTTSLDGWVLFEVPRAGAADPLELVYAPRGFVEPVATFALREPGPAPDPVPDQSPGPTPFPVTYLQREGYPFTVIDSAEADTLFDTPDTCSNPVAGYTVTYPDDWYTNTEIGDWPACTWFSPSYYEVGDDLNEVPPQVAIVLVYDNVSYGYTSEPDFAHAAQISVDVFNANRAELVGMTWPNGEYRPQPPSYFYMVYLGDQPAEEPTLRATTNFEGAADYELNKAVLDRIMALIEFDE